MSDAVISVVGAKEHNLKNINVKIPRNQFVVLTGVSGSGKSSLAFDTLYAEGQRRYVESLSSYARQFLEQLKKPEVESIEGLSAAIAIEQKSISENPRSTVGTLTEIYDYLRLLFSKIGHILCPRCYTEVTSQSTSQIVDYVLKFPVGEEIGILAPIVQERKGEYQKELSQLRRSGFTKVKIDGAIKDLSESFHLDKNKKHSIDVYVDRVILKEGIQNRLKTSLDTAFELSSRFVKIERVDGTQQLISAAFSCMECETSFAELEPRLFSFNSPVGCCPRCAGMGFQSPYETIDRLLENPLSRAGWEEIGEDFNFEDKPCPSCQGQRLRPEALSVRIQGKSIADVCNLSLDEGLHFFSSLDLTEREKVISHRILKEIRDRLQFLLNVGVSYLTLDRRASTLSGGEERRVRLAAQIGSPLIGVLYVLDEPSIGLHPRDNSKLILSLKTLKDRGNTVLTVEHDRETILHADHIIDMGPGAGIHGGAIVSQGDLKTIMADEKSITGDYLSNRKTIPIPPRRRKPNEKYISLDGATQNNLKDISVHIPLGLLIGITGVSGSGKSTLIVDTIYHALAKKLYGAQKKVGAHKKIVGLEHIDQVIDVDQSPIGRTPRSNPATYTGIFSHVRNHFSQLPESKIRGYKSGRYSFNVSGGRCETCGGAGLIKMEMHFLPDMYIQCEMCQGKRYNRETLEIHYKGKNISEVLEMTVDEALIFFNRIPHIKIKLKTLQDVGLGYIHLGQQATTLSGGEAQRIKLATELGKRTSGRAVFILDEPTTGLHFEDIHRLMSVLQKLVDLGNTVIVIEHNLEVIKSCDYLIDLGPEGGDKGGYIVAEGTPEKIAQAQTSATGQYLRQILQGETER